MIGAREKADLTGTQRIGFLVVKLDFRSFMFDHQTLEMNQTEVGSGHFLVGIVSLLAQKPIQSEEPHPPFGAHFRSEIQNLRIGAGSSVHPCRASPSSATLGL